MLLLGIIPLKMEQRSSSLFDNIPVEIVDLILWEVARGDEWTAVMLPFVCRLWRDRKAVWMQPMPLKARRAFERFAKQPSILSEEAALRGNLSALSWLKEKGAFKLTLSVANSAAKGGHLEVLKWLREKGCPWDATTCASAAKGGHLEVLRWAREQGCPLNQSVCASAAENGHLEVLKWLQEIQCPWDEMTCYRAASGGFKEVVHWLREQGCPRDDRTCYGAAKGLLRIVEMAESEWLPLVKSCMHQCSRGGTS